jgi:fumarylacetoacetase
MTDKILDPNAASLRSFVASANDPAGDFPIQNLPFGVVDGAPAVRIGDRAIVLADLVAKGVFDLAAVADEGELARAELEIALAHGEGLNDFAALPAAVRARVRGHLAWMLAEGAPERARVEPLLRAAADADHSVPFVVTDYTDFYASLHHATNVGSMMRPDNPLLPNWKHIPIGYHGRASSIVPSGTEIVRPHGQTVAPDASSPAFGPSKGLDYELEVGFFLSHGNELGEPIPVSGAWRHIFGFVLVNDWSARDIQKWEYQPLGPFLSKSFATTVSPWVVTTDALEPFLVAGPVRGADDPKPLAYLDDPAGRNPPFVLEVLVSSAAMRAQGMEPTLVSRGSFADMFWTPAQMLAHHASNGCRMQGGDLLASGTVSGPTKESRGCLLERAWRGAEPITLGDGTTRAFLQDGDEVILRGWCEAPGRPRIGFGECRGVVLPAR